MSTPNKQVDWDALYRERAARLKRLLDLNSPRPLVELAAKLLLKTEFHNSTTRMAWHWFIESIRRQIRSWKTSLGIFRLRLQGWPRLCAIDIYFGDWKSNHKKIGCECGAEWEQFEEEMRRDAAKEVSK